MDKRVITIMSFLVASSAITAFAGLNVDVNIGVPSPPTAVVTPAPTPQAYAPPPPVPAPVPEVVYTTQPQFIYSPTLGYYVSIGTPYDIAYIGNTYYLYSGGFWYAGPSYSGPWVLAQGRALPRLLVRYPYERIRFYRDREYRVYLRDPDHYRGRMYRPAWVREERHERRGDMRREEHRH